MDEDAWAKIGGVATLALCAWLWLPRNNSWAGTSISYTVTSSDCSQYICNLDNIQFLNPVKLTIDKQSAKVTWFDDNTKLFGSYNNCAISDYENWSCNDDASTTFSILYTSHKMVDGVLDDNMGDVAAQSHHMGGARWRINWLFSLLHGDNKAQTESVSSSPAPVRNDRTGSPATATNARPEQESPAPQVNGLSATRNENRNAASTLGTTSKSEPKMQIPQADGPDLSGWTGHWVKWLDGGFDINIQLESAATKYFRVYGVGRGGIMSSIVAFDGRAVLDGDELVYSDAGSCRVEMRLQVSALAVTDNGLCGTGGSSFNGTYTRE